LGRPLLNAQLNEKQWGELMQINQALCEDFQLRRELLLTRLDVTVQSFKWSDHLKDKNLQIANTYQQKRKELSIKQHVKLFYVLAARDGKHFYILIDKYLEEYIIRLIKKQIYLNKRKRAARV